MKTPRATWGGAGPAGETIGGAGEPGAGAESEASGEENRGRINRLWALKRISILEKGFPSGERYCWLERASALGAGRVRS